MGQWLDRGHSDVFNSDIFHGDIGMFGVYTLRSLRIHYTGPFKLKYPLSPGHIDIISGLICEVVNEFGPSADLQTIEPVSINGAALPLRPIVLESSLLHIHR